MNIKKYLLETVKYALRSYPIIRPYIKEVERLYAMNAEELHKRNEKKFLKIFRRAYDKSPFYHKLYTEAGIKKEDITCLDDLKKLPIITKDMVRQYADDILIIPRWMVIRANTSGTTGTPLKIYESWPSIWLSQAYTYCARFRNGFTYGQALISLRGNLDKSQISLKVHVSNTLYLSSYNINQQTIRFYYNLIVKHNPVAIEGYPSSLYSLAVFLKGSGLKLKIPVAFTSSETLLDYQRKLIEEQMGTEIFDNYGMGEQTIYLQEAYNHQGYYEIPGYSINEFVEDGEICTSLTNEAFPMIRYRSNDIMEMAEASEDNSQIVVKKEGRRVKNYLCCKDGTYIMHLNFVFKGVKNVKYSQLIQDNSGLLLVRIVPESEFGVNDKMQIEYNLLQKIGVGNIDYQIELITEQEMKHISNSKLNLLIKIIKIKTGKVIKRIIGRVDDYILCKDGSMVTRVDFIESGEHIKACQWVQKEKGKVIICIVPDEGFTEKDKKFVVNETQKRVGVENMDIEVKLTSIEQLVYSHRGKFRLVVNQMGQENV